MTATVDGDSLDVRLLLSTLAAFQEGDFSARLPPDWTGTAGKVAGTVNGIIETSGRMSQELARLGRAAGKEGKPEQRDYKKQLGEVRDWLEEEARRNRFFTLSPGLLCIAGLDGYFRQLNPSWERTLGYTPEELKSRPFLEFVHPDDRQATLDALRELEAGESVVRFENRYRGRDGSYRWLMWNVAGHAEQRLIYGVAHDVTAHRQAELALRESEDLYRSLFKNLLNGFAYCRMLFEDGRPQDFIYLAVNDAFESLTGLTGVVGRKVTEVLPGIREADPLLFEIYGRVALTGQPERFEMFVETLRMWFLISVYSPAHEHFVTVFDVITKRKRAELALQVSHHELEAFSYSVSHDLRAPLRAIDGFSQALEEDCGERLDETGRRYLERIRSATRRMGLLIDALLHLSRVSRTELLLSGVDLSAMAWMVARELQERDPRRKVELAIANGVTARGDSTLLRTVLENLLGNAWKFTGKRKDARIEFGVDCRGGWPVYSVRDNGAGFHMKYAGRLFTPFQRLHAEAEFPGTGIGLATVQRVVRRHGGRVWAESAPGLGTAIHFTLGGEE